MHFYNINSNSIKNVEQLEENKFEIISCNCWFKSKEIDGSK